jgi:hypothetical protein
MNKLNQQVIIQCLQIDATYLVGNEFQFKN